MTDFIRDLSFLVQIPIKDTDSKIEPNPSHDLGIFILMDYKDYLYKYKTLLSNLNCLNYTNFSRKLCEPQI